MPQRDYPKEKRPNLREIRAYVPEGIGKNIESIIQREGWGSISSFVGMLIVLGLQAYCKQQHYVELLSSLDTDSQVATAEANLAELAENPDFEELE